MASAVDTHLHGVNFESFNHTNTILKGLNDLRLKGCLFDITLKVEDKSFKAHKAVLAACSDYFRAMFIDCMKEANQNEVSLSVSSQGIELLLEYIYTSKLQLNLANIQNVLAAASYTQLDSVVEACLNYLQDQLDIDNCIDILTISETYSLNSLKERVYRFICGHLFEVSQINEFIRLTFAQLSYILSCDYPVDCSESQVLSQVVLQWIIQTNLPVTEENEQLNNLLKQIRFNEMPLTAVKQALSHNQLTPKHDLYKIVITHARTERKKFRTTQSLLNSASLVNSRGMEIALIKIGGFDLSGITNEITYCFPNAKTPSEQVWRYLTSIPHIKQSNFGCVVLNNQLYVVGGCYDISLEEYIHPFGFRYCPITNKWQTISPMNQDRCRFSLNVVGSRIYAIGGVSESHDDDMYDGGETNYSSGEVYNPETDKWEFITALPEYRSQHASCAVDRYLYISGGLDQFGGVLSTFWKYNTTCNYWTQLPPMLTGRADHVILNIGAKLYICGGWYEINTTRILAGTIDVFNYATNSWSTLTRIPTPKFHAGIVHLNNKIYIIGGFCSDDIFRHTASRIEVFDIDKNTWSVMDNYPKNIWEHACASLYIPKCREDMVVIDS
ncbi:kelch-like protein 12 [Culicoides brevitarsis]|uniref:kelch-like protein 12 n=1 Tax=Culicoides brevitarsis TaxID=469753 RepID=UPI00307C172A